MENQQKLISTAFQTFRDEAPGQAQAWGEMVGKLAETSALDAKTGVLAYIAILSVIKAHSGIPFHVTAARQLGVTREEVISAVLLGLPVTGNGVTQALPIALAAYDAAGE